MTRDDGFSLVEVVVAIGIVMVLLVAVLPQLVGGIKANALATSNTQAKALASSELERMRNLPFHVEPTAGDFIDLLDRFFHDRVAPLQAPTCTDAQGRSVAPTTSNAGFVAANATHCPWEPAGAFYRTVRTDATDPDLDGFVVTTAAQFLDAKTPPAPVEPPAGYDTGVVGKDTPATNQVGVTVTVLRETTTDRRPVSTYTQVSRGYQTTTQLRATAEATALEASTMLPGPDVPAGQPPEGNAVALSGALLHLDSSLVAGSRVEVTAAGLTATAATGENSGTTRTAFIAPPGVAPSWDAAGGGQLTTAGCSVVCWGGGQAYGTWTPTTTNGLPGVGRPEAPVEVALKTPSEGGHALKMGMGPGALLRPELGLFNPVLRLRAGDFSAGISSSCTVTDGGNQLRLASGGWARTTAAPTGGADACAASRTASVSVLPYGGGEDLPLVLVRLKASSARCTVSGATHVPDTELDFAVRVSYWDGDGYELVGEYTETGTATLPDPSTLSVGGRPLSTWIESWSVARETDGVSRVEAPGVARLDVPAIVSILTVPLRNRVDAAGAPVLDGDGDPVVDELSTLSVTVGSIGCTAEDHR